MDIKETHIYNKMEWIIELTKKIPYGIFVEIGTDRGTSAMAILDNNPTCFLYCIDPYQRYDEYEDQINNVTGDLLYQSVSTFLKNKYGHRVKFIRKFSDEAVYEIPYNIDFLYIDGNHKADFVYNDIKNYYPKLKMHGIMLLDDAIDRGTGNEHRVWAPDCYGTYGVMTGMKRYFGNQRIHMVYNNNQLKIIRHR